MANVTLAALVAEASEMGLDPEKTAIIMLNTTTGGIVPAEAFHVVADSDETAEIRLTTTPNES